MNDDALTRNGQGELAVRTVSTSGDNYVDKNDVYTRDDEGKLCVRTVGGGGGSGAVDSVNGKTGVVVLDAEDVGAMAATTITTVSASTLTQELAGNTIYDCGELSALTITLPATMTADWACQVNFTSGTTPTSLTAPNTIKWKGDDLTAGVFVPVASKRYAILFFTDGVNVRGIVQAVA